MITPYNTGTCHTLSGPRPLPRDHVVLRGDIGGGGEESGDGRALRRRRGGRQGTNMVEREREREREEGGKRERGNKLSRMYPSFSPRCFYSPYTSSPPLRSPLYLPSIPVAFPIYSPSIPLLSPFFSPSFLAGQVIKSRKIPSFYVVPFSETE